MLVDYEKAKTILIEEASKPAAHVDRTWDSAIETFHKACHGAAQTHIAVLGTAILAKCVDINVDVFALQRRAGANGYSARSLSNKVLAPKAREMDIHLGVTGLEPHQNSPYTGETRIRRDFDVRTYARSALTVFLEWGPLVRQILLWGPIPSLQAAKDLPAFILERLEALEVPVSSAEAWSALFPAPAPEEDQETE